MGDVIAKGVTTLADKMAEEQPTAPFNRITDIRKAIGLNDKFLMIRDLFGGDVNLYEDTINHLNEFDDLDECMIFIVENFRWNPDSEEQSSSCRFSNANYHNVIIWQNYILYPRPLATSRI